MENATRTTRKGDSFFPVLLYLELEHQLNHGLCLFYTKFYCLCDQISRGVIFFFFVILVRMNSLCLMFLVDYEFFGWWQTDAVDPKSRHKGKLETESLLESRGVNWTSIRPVYIYGPLNYNPVEEWFFHRLKAGRPIPVPNSGVQITQLGHVKVNTANNCQYIYSCLHALMNH